MSDTGRKLFPTFRRYILTGLIVWIPIGITFLVVKALIELLDKLLLILPQKWQPEALIGVNLPGAGMLLAFAVILITGFLLTNIFGRQIIAWWDRLVSHIPIISSLHSAVKQLIETFFNQDSSAFKKVLMIQYPRPGLWTLAFQSNDAADEINSKSGLDMVSIFVPTSPNPTSGFVLLVPKNDVIEMDMSVEDGLRMIMSLGVVQPMPSSTLDVKSTTDVKTTTDVGS